MSSVMSAFSTLQVDPIAPRLPSVLTDADTGEVILPWPDVWLRDQRVKWGFKLPNLTMP
jgi:hypothetical protein